MMVRRAAGFLGVGVPSRVVYQNARRALGRDRATMADPIAAPVLVVGRRLRGAARSILDLAALIEQMNAVVAERDRLRLAIDGIRAALKSIR